MSGLILHEDPKSGNCYKIRLVAAHLKLPLERRSYDIMKGETRTPEFLRDISANGRIPVLQDGDRFLTESNAICYYLANGSELIPDGHYDQADMLRWMFWEQYNHEPSVATLRFWLRYIGIDALTDAQRIQISPKREAGLAALDLMDKHLASKEMVRRRPLQPRRHLPVRLHPRRRRGQFRPRDLSRNRPLDGADHDHGPGMWGWKTKLRLPLVSLGTTSRLDAGRSGKGRPLLFVETKMAPPLMPHATAAWLVDNSSLSFTQIADFCGLHVLEVQAIADDTAATKLTGRDPIRSGELTHEEIEKGQADPDYALQMHKAPDPVTRTKGPRYTPVSKRQDKPDGIAWIIRNHPEVSDGQISKLIGTTRTTIAAIRDRTHWNMANIQPKDPGDPRPDLAA